ncbi:hypothetical protein [Actinacidiphila acididurans]|uniref:hypothetical protein n=1 Tax=Actinacidiphila acididurans TaxID=2784346 RepID=UPI001F1E6894|nr:hypothetical protein [Actinacidiphila acididurans]
MGAPWWVVAIAVVLAIVTPGTILFVQAVVPQDSEHKRDLWLAIIRFLERRRRRRWTSRNRQCAAADATGASQHRRRALRSRRPGAPSAVAVLEPGGALQ